MSWTKTQIANHINGKIKYSFNISDSYQLEFNTYDNRYDFEEFKNICKKNAEYWNRIYKDVNNGFANKWRVLYEQVTNAETSIMNLESLDVDVIVSHFINNIGNVEHYQEEKIHVLKIRIDAPINKDKKNTKIRSFVSFYINYDIDYIEHAVCNYINLNKNELQAGQLFSSTRSWEYYPALYFIKNELINNKFNVSEIKENIIKPASEELDNIYDNANKKFREITAFVDDKYSTVKNSFDEIKTQIDSQITEIKEWKIEEFEEFKNLKKAYIEHLSLEAPERLWNQRSNDHKIKTIDWTIVLISVVLLLIGFSTCFIKNIHKYSIGIINEVPFLSESFILISVISFFIYIIRILVKIVMSHHHLYVEYEQKAAMTRFYQALIKADTKINEQEKIIIINALFSKVDSGLVKTDGSGDSDALLAIISKSIRNK